MSNTIDDGGPAFPFAATDVSNMNMQSKGMTLRDWFAGQVMIGLCSPLSKNGALDPYTLAFKSYQYADAMIEARTGKEQA